jgi:hypothetical protein
MTLSPAPVALISGGSVGIAEFGRLDAVVANWGFAAPGSGRRRSRAVANRVQALFRG